MPTPDTAPPVPWRAGLATGIGSLPGADPQEAASLIAGELADFPHLVELPARGPAADMLGRALAICADLPGELTATGWRLARRAGRDHTRAVDFLAWDLDAAQQHYSTAPHVKLQIAGPWTVAAHVELPRGQRILADVGAVRDVAQSLQEGVQRHIADIQARLPGSEIVVQIDEPALPAVLAGTLRTASGLSTLPAVPEADAERVLRDLTAALSPHGTILHCCDTSAPINMAQGAGFSALSIPLAGITSYPARLDLLGEAIDAGMGLFAGTIEPRGLSPAFSYREAVGPLREVWHQLGFRTAQLSQVAVTPTCGMAGIDQATVRHVLSVLASAARYLDDAVHNM